MDDLITAATARGHGHADLLMTWAKQEAQRLNCEGVHLDSGVGPDRAAAHRLYMRHHLRISAHHFTVPTEGR
ncbi:GNAT family N-acetyltransferase [Nocardia sp. CA-128927]|uniref:GNAT family N-acetyltransferase n=1 Tax=Nocardia sp. CA-128927 TaxID=3239975 RepID=UPI003D963E48